MISYWNILAGSSAVWNLMLGALQPVLPPCRQAETIVSCSDSFFYRDDTPEFEELSESTQYIYYDNKTQKLLHKDKIAAAVFCNTESYCFINDISAYISSMINHDDEFSHIPIEALKSGFLQIQVWTYDDRKRTYVQAVVNDFAQKLEPEGSYVFKIKFSDRMDSRYPLIFTNGGLNYASSTFFLPYFTQVSNVYLRKTDEPAGKCDIKFEGWFEIDSGRLVKKHMYTYGWLDDYKCRKDLESFLNL